MIAPPGAMPPPFRHLHAAHCESGVTAALFSNRGFEISEPMVFGIGGGLFFCHAPFLKVMGIPLTSYRSYPLTIFKKTCGRLGIRFRTRSFWSREKGVRELDSLLEQGIPVGLQANMFWLSYFPQQFRWQFNGHNLVALSHAGADYEISDPVLETKVTCPAQALTRARFARGPLSPRGRIYYPLTFPPEPEIGGTIREAIRETCSRMLGTPVAIAGVRGIRYLSRRMRSWPEKLRDPRRVKLYLANIVRMQEEVGTGGAGFRFMYAAFLQEAGERLGHDPLLRACEMMTSVGDRWRKFAEASALVCKDRADGKLSITDLADRLLEIADLEEEVFRFLKANLPRAA